MDFKEFQNSIVEAVADKVKNSKKKRELSPEEKERRRKVFAENVKKAKEKKTKATKQTSVVSEPVYDKLEPTRVEAVLPSMPVQTTPQMPDFDNFFKTINERFDKLESKFQTPNIQSPNMEPKKIVRNDVIKQKPAVFQPPRAIAQPMKPVQQQPKIEVPKPVPEQVHVYSAFKPNPWS